ncbi:hypothetical protein HanXRQr2_Chr06g0278261 [Helianthus annuus]|nr:hypothetical protein HanXRQr2_Chr06g0278261 [Helianthus annuus]
MEGGRELALSCFSGGLQQQLAARGTREVRSNPSVDADSVETMVAPGQHSNLISHHKLREADGAIGGVVGGGVGDFGNGSEKLGGRQGEVIMNGGAVGGEPGTGVEGDEAEEEAEDDEQPDEEDEFRVEIDGVVVRRGWG